MKLMIMLSFWVVTISNLFLISQSCLHQQSSLLLQFKQEFADSSSDTRMENWNSVRNCCRWDGISCDELGRVVGLDLSEGSLTGSLRPNSSLFALIHLRRLNLARNDFSDSSIPAALGRLSRLRRLDLSQSVFAGQIPSEISLLKRLVSLDLSGSSLGDDEPPPLTLGKEVMEGLIRNMTGLKELSLDAVDLSSLHPKVFGNFSSLEKLSLSQSRLTGRFPESVFRLPKLRNINLSSNRKLTGSIPEFGPDSRLESLILYNTKFSGALSDSIGNLEFLNELDLHQCNFSGTVPSSLGDLFSLTSLDLSNNKFTGEIPSSLGRLARLTSLSASRNLLVGKIPSSLGNLTTLTNLDLSNNILTGGFPVIQANLTELSSFDISYNLFSGPIPDDAAKIFPNSPSLGSLDLSHNSFNGTIPTWFFRMPSLFILMLDSNNFTGPLTIRNASSSQLTSLYLRHNRLTGAIPSSISELTALSDLYLNANELTGNIDLGFFSNLTSLSTLQLSYNNLSMTDQPHNTTIPELESLGLASCDLVDFPKFLRTQSNLHDVDLTRNRISGDIPRWFLDVGTETLARMYLSENQISGWEKEPSVLPWNALEYLDLSTNRLRGSLVPPPPSTLQYFASENNLTGEISPSFCKLRNLKVLHVSDNKLSGEIPPCLGLNNSLTVLNLKRNALQGNIPSLCSHGSGKNLKTLDLSQNALHGTMPTSLTECKELEVLNIGHNHIIDEFPFWTQTLPRLQVLILRDNEFHGDIWNPKKFFGFEKLRIVDLSFNGFTGALPADYFQNWTVINSEIPGENKSVRRYMEDPDNYYKDSMTLSTKGSNRDYSKILTNLMAVDLSNNKLTGAIPISVGNLKSLVVLNLSSNNFQGRIPRGIGNLNSLESLDLSKNELSGEIPGELSALTFLAYLNLSENSLQGQIPRGGQLNTFSSSSYGGNEGLCGFPLTEKCGAHEESAKGVVAGGFGIDWRPVVIGCGFGLLIGVIVEYMVSLRKPNLMPYRYIEALHKHK